MKPKPPKCAYLVVEDCGTPMVIVGRELVKHWRAQGSRVIRYIPAPPKRRKPRRGYRAGGMS